MKNIDTKKSLGIMIWYDNEKGFGVLQNINDHKEFFIHQSKVWNRYKTIFKEEDLVIFTPDFDQKRNRDIAINIRHINNHTDLKWVITTWIKEEYITDIHIEKILIDYLRFFSKDNGECFCDENNRLIDIFSSISKKEIELKKLYFLYKKAIDSVFDQQKSTRLSEMTDLIMMEKIPSDLYSIILETAKTSYICLVLAHISVEVTETAINKAVEISKNICDLLDELIRFTKDINEQDVKESLDNDKSLITDEDFWNRINGENIISATIKHLYNYVNLIEIKTLIKQGYICNIDNSILISSRPDIFVELKVYAYNECLVDEIDVQFITDNIDKFSAHNLVIIEQYYELPDDLFSNVVLCYIRNLLSQKGSSSSYDEITIFAGEIPDVYKLITNNHEYLSENAEKEYQELLLSLYKASLVHEIDENFIIYYIKRFNISEISSILCCKQVKISQSDYP